MVSREPEHPVQRERLRPQASYCYLLDADADLAQEFDLRMRVVARQVATVVVFEIPIGEHAPAEWLEPQHRAAWACCCSTASSPSRSRSATGPPPSSRAPATCCSRAGRDGDDLLEHLESWHVLVPARVAVLDAGFAERVRPVAADRPGPAAPRGQARRATSTSSAPSPASRGWRSAWR